MRRVKRLVKILDPRGYRGWRRYACLGLIGLILGSVTAPVVSFLVDQQRYVLAADEQSLIGPANANLAAKITYDPKQQLYQFNKAGIKNDSSGPAAKLKTQAGGTGKKSPSLYSVNLPRDAAKGMTYYDDNLQLSFSMTPQFKLEDGKLRQNRLVYPLNGGQAVYTAKSNGLKEDLVLHQAQGDTVEFSYRLNLPGTLEARTIPGSGAVGIYSADPSLFGSISFGSDEDREKVMSARTRGTKDHLVFALPAPEIKQSGKGGGHPQAKFSLDGDTLLVTAVGLAKAAYPLTIDPSVVITSSSDFAAGNNEGNIDFPGGQINRGGLTGGSLNGGWTASATALPAAREFGGSAVYNGYLYEVSGYDGTVDQNDVQYCALSTSGGVTSCARQTSVLITAKDNFGYAAYDGYLYIVGGSTNNSTSGTNDIQHCPINPDASIGACVQQVNAFTGTRMGLSAAVYGGYLYIIGGYTSTYQNDIQYCPINANGSIGACTQQTAAFPTAREYIGATAYNGYLYMAGGYSGSYLNDLIYCPLGSNGSVGSCTQQASAFVTARYGASVVAVDGYLYIAGGYTGSAYTPTVTYCELYGSGVPGTCNATQSMNTGRMMAGLGAYSGYLYLSAGGNGSPLASVEYAKVDPPGTATSFTASANNMVYGCDSGGGVAVNGYIYYLAGLCLLSGRFGSYSSAVYSAKINSDGSIGTWANDGTALPKAIQMGGIVAYSGYIYLIGGYDGTNRLGSVYYALANTTGGTGAWSTNATSLVTARSDMGATVYKGYVYVGGGQNTSGTLLNSVEYAPLNADGSVGTWTQSANTFSLARLHNGLAATNSFLYVIDGDNNGSTYYNNVDVASINSDGSLGTFSAAATFNTPRSFAGVAANKGVIYLLAGQNGSILGDLQYAVVNPSTGALTWYTSPYSLNTGRKTMAFAVYQDTLYAYGGNNNGYLKTTEYAFLNNGGAGTVGGWAATTSFTTTREHHSTVVYNNYIYVIGGNGGTLSDVQYALLTAAGSLAPNAGCGTVWCTTSSLPTGRSDHSSVVYNGYMYVIGGNNGTTSYSNDVLYAPINSNGTVGAWHYTYNSADNGTNFAGGFTTGRQDMGAAVYNGYVYIFGGYNGSSLADAQYAQLNSNGTVGTWNSATGLPQGRSWLAAVAYNGYAYILGGYSGSSYLNSVYYAPINAGGSLGSWTQTASFTTPRNDLAATAYNGYLYILGGNNGSVMSDVQMAPIHSGGWLGAWTATASFTTARHNHTTAFGNGYLYILGGNNGSTTLNDVQYAPINSIARAGRYSKLIDLGTISALGNLTYNGSLPGGMSSISVRTADSSGVLGTVSAATSLASQPANCVTGFSASQVRYVYVSVMMDDTLTAIYPDSVSSDANLADFTLSYAGVHPLPGLRLYQGKSFYNQQLQPLDTCTP